jgi:hypothetical protein
VKQKNGVKKKSDDHKTLSSLNYTLYYEKSN